MNGQTIKVDPLDPKTWWKAQHARRGNWVGVSAQMHDHAMVLSGIPARRFYFDGKLNIMVKAAVSAYYRFDIAATASDIYNYEAEALGQRMVYSDEAMPTIDFRAPLISKYEDLEKLKSPDNWLERGRIPFALDLIKGGRELSVDRGAFCAPFSLAVGLRTYPKLIRDMRRDPPFAHDLFTRLVDDILPSYLKAMKEECGVSLAVGADAWAAFPNLTPEMIEEWVLPYVLRLNRNTSKFGLISVCPTAGDYCEEDISKFDKETLYKCFDAQIKLSFRVPSIALAMGRWQDYPIEAVAEYLKPLQDKGQRARVICGVNARLLREGPIEAIMDNIKRFIQILGSHEVRIFLANIPADAPSEHIHAAVAAVHTYGQLPLTEDIERIQVPVPEREPFNEYLNTMSRGQGLRF